MRAQNKLLEEKEAFTEKRNEQASGLNSKYKIAKRDFKDKKLEQRTLLAEIKSKHEQIMNLEEKTRKLTLLVKAKKDKGLSPRSSALSGQ